MSKTATVTELVVEGFNEGGFRAEHALACAMADASPKLIAVCQKAIAFLEKLPNSAERNGLLDQLNDALPS